MAPAALPVLRGLAGGGFLITWNSESWSILGRSYLADGAPAGGEFFVPTYTHGNQFNPSIAGLAGGGFVVVWDSRQDGRGWGIAGRRYLGNGEPVGNELGNFYWCGREDSNLHGSPH